MKEIKSVLFAMGKLKDSKPDGYQARLFHIY